MNRWKMFLYVSARAAGLLAFSLTLFLKRCPTSSILSRIETNARVSVRSIVYRAVVYANDKGTVNTGRKKKR